MNNKNGWKIKKKKKIVPKQEPDKSKQHKLV
jgi:hypothetical protein